MDSPHINLIVTYKGLNIFITDDSFEVCVRSFPDRSSRSEIYSANGLFFRTPYTHQICSVKHEQSCIIAVKVSDDEERPDVILYVSILFPMNSIY